MLDDAFADLERQIEAGEIQVALLELLDDAQRLQIVIEALAVRAQQFVQLALARVAEGRVADVVDEGQGFGEIGIQAQGAGDGARDLRDFERVREPVAKVVGIPCGKHLRLCFEAAEGARMNHAVAVPRVVVAVGMWRLGITPAARPGRVHRIRGKGHGTILCHRPRDANPLRAGFEGSALIVGLKLISSAIPSGARNLSWT